LHDIRRDAQPAPEVCKQPVNLSTNGDPSGRRPLSPQFWEHDTMSKHSRQQHVALRRVAAAAIAAGTLSLVATLASAGECPADKRVADGHGQKPGPSAARDVTDVVRSSTDLSKEPLALNGRLFRLRQLEMKPGGIVPWHSHNERPAMIYIVSGEVVEYASSCAVPIVHRAGEVAPEKNGTSHWWQNHGNTTAVLISVDLFPNAPKMDAHMM
jgi:quercetin dioxygenase-like cupin family protein